MQYYFKGENMPNVSSVEVPPAAGGVFVSASSRTSRAPGIIN